MSNKTVGHTGIARLCFALSGNRTRSPHFKRSLSGGSMSPAALGLVNDMYAENSNDDYKGYKEVATQEDFDKF